MKDLNRKVAFIDGDANRLNELNIKASILVAYDYTKETWFVLGGDSTTGKLDVDTT